MGALTDAVTFAFADPAAAVYGLARLGLSGEDDGRRGSALAVVFADGAPVAALAEGDVPVAADADWDELALPGLAAAVDAPLASWRLRLAAGSCTLALRFDALSPPAAHDLVGGMAGYEQLCRVEGEAVLDGRTVAVSGRGQRGHTWGAPDWRRLEAVHSVSAWLDGDLGVALTVPRAAGAKGHGGEEAWAALLEPGGTAPIADPRLSTTYDGAGHQRRVGLELWADEESAPRRAAGSAICGSTLDLGALRLDCAFVRWTMEGRTGVGRYDVLRRASG